MTTETCACVVAALVEMAPDPHTVPGCYFHCASHGQLVVFTGRRWVWSNQPEDFEQLPRMAGCDDLSPVPD
ncbi:hypothetical protein ABZ281_07765 [Streptomyces sp. NPDC006265]|uniref:hypothetical protein n=1 Tax=Streptomyces sp. NPDC006265 TaxID=3156740 RepID=UPI0033BCF407